MPLPSGARVGPYEVVGLLGAGGMGEVYLAHDVRLRRPVALKRLSDAAIPTPEARRQLLNEARAAAQLNHPGIAAVHDVIEQDHRPYIVMEYVDGESLARRASGRCLPPSEVVEIAIQLAEAVGAAHAKGIIHRDLKPANVQVTPTGSIKVLDFGVAKILPRSDPDDVTRTADEVVEHAARLLGTPAYMSPEQLRGAAIDGRSDVYSLGVILFELFTGRLPFQERELLPLAAAILSSPPPLASDVSPSVPADAAALVARMLEKDPGRRPPSIEQVQLALRSIRDRLLLGDSAAPSPAASRVVSRRLRMGVMAAALVVVTVGAWLAYRFGPLRGTHPAVPAIVVLPLSTRDGGTEEQAIGEGIAKSIEAALVDSRGLRVRICSNPLECPSRQRDPIRIGRELNADLVVDGRVQRSEGSVHLTLQLLEVGTSEIVWTRQFAGEPKDILRGQDQLARQLAEHLSEQRSVAIDPDRVGRRIQVRSTSHVGALEKYSRAQLLMTRADAPQNIETAIELLERAVAEDPSYALAHAALGQAYWTRYERTHTLEWADKARQACLNALAIDADQVEVRVALARYYSGTRQFDRALEQIEAALAMQPEYDEAFRVRSAVLADRGEDAAAQADAERAIRLAPSDWRNALALGYVHYRANRREQARESYRRAVELQPDNAWGWLMLGAISLELNDAPRAIAELKRANDAHESAAAWANIGTAYYWQGRHAEAAEAFERAAALEPDNPVHHRNAGDAYARLGQPHEARTAYERAVQTAERVLHRVNPDDPHRLAQLAVYKAKVGRIAEARRHLATAERAGPLDATVLFRKAVVEALAGDPAASWRALRAAMDKGVSAAVACQDDDLAELRRMKEFSRMCAA